MSTLHPIVEDLLAPTDGRSRAGRRRDEIVTAAASLFAVAGYHEVGMRAIAHELGIRGASLYHHFASKEQILHAISLRVTREPVDLNLPLLDAPGTPTERLSALARAHLTHLRRRRVEHLVGLHELSALAPAHRAEIDGYRRFYQRRVRDVIEAGMRRGDFSVPDARLASFALLDSLNGISHWYHDDGELAVEEVVDGYVQLLIGGLLGAGRPWPPHRYTKEANANADH